MDNPSGELFNAIDAATLEPIVRKALDRDGARLADWKIETLFGASPNSQIYRFSGSAASGDESLPWSLILKIIGSEDGTDDPTSLGYWKREALAYESGLLETLPAGLRAPRCFQTVEQPGLKTWLWMEEIVKQGKTSWTVEQYGEIAYQLGLFNGYYSHPERMPVYPWLAKNWLRMWVSGTENNLPLSPEVLANPLVSQIFPPDVLQRVMKVWSEHEAWLGCIERQPQTLCHMDAFSRNLFRVHDQAGNPRTFMIDWAFLASAAAGEEISPLVAGSLNFLDISPDQAEALDQAVFAAYLKGLEEAGWQGAPRWVRFTYAASVVLRFSIGVIGIANMIADPGQHSFLEQAFSHPVEELVDVWAQTSRFFYDLADEAREIYSTM